MTVTVGLTWTTRLYERNGQNEGPVASAYVCNDGADNDGDGLIDSDDPACEDGYGSDETDPVTGCNDGTDNDNDGWTDAEDPDCATGTVEVGFGDTDCNDEVDNDGDGQMDFDDEDVPMRLTLKKKPFHLLYRWFR